VEWLVVLGRVDGEFSEEVAGVGPDGKALGDRLREALDGS
jgi:hypothetical protein